MAFAGFNKRKVSSIGGDFDGDGIKNRKDCEPLNWKKQGPEHKKKLVAEYKELLNRDIEDFGRGIKNTSVKRRMKEIEEMLR